MTPARFAFLTLAACFLGCAPPQETDTGTAYTTGADALTTTNGRHLNGRHLNGRHLNGRHLNGVDLGSTIAAVSFQDVSLDEEKLDRTWLSGTVFNGWRGEVTYSGTLFAGAQFSGVTDTGVPVDVRIDSIGREAAPDDDVWNYWVSFRIPATVAGDYFEEDAWSPACSDDAGVAVAAIPVNGRWDYRTGVRGGGGKIADPDSFTFACKGLGAIAKCLFPIGYKPWKTVKGVSLDRQHQACVRLIRGDFCGTGTPYTVDGSAVDLYDGVGVQKSTAFLWLIEAEWDENGARCFNPLNRSHKLLIPCFNDRALAACGAPIDFWLGALLMNKTPPLSQLPPLLR